MLDEYIVTFFQLLLSPYVLILIFYSTLGLIIYILTSRAIVKIAARGGKGKPKKKSKKAKKKREPTAQLTEPRERGPFLAIMVIAVMILAIVYALARIFGVA